jgi:hypothetical protein
VIGNEVPVTEKPEPEAAMLEIVNAVVPGFDTTTVCPEVTPTVTFPKLMLVGETEIPGCPWLTPVPLIVTDMLGVGELFVTVIVPDRLPIAGGTISALKLIL